MEKRHKESGYGSNGSNKEQTLVTKGQQESQVYLEILPTTRKKLKDNIQLSKDKKGLTASEIQLLHLHHEDNIRGAQGLSGV